MALAKCQKFTANIYDKNRCKNCYRPKEVHSEAALESNKVSRKIAKCGYLFVAPDTFDFKSPLDRTRRWQRRFFVLYDDGELTYSVDENVNTVPQGVIDMNKCSDVYSAENITSHPHSIAIATPDHVTFIKGSTKEETNRWYDILVMYPRSNTKVKQKKPIPVNENAGSQIPLPSKTTKTTSDSSPMRSQPAIQQLTDPEQIRQQYSTVTPSTSDLISDAAMRSSDNSRLPRKGRSPSTGEPLSPRHISGTKTGDVTSASASAFSTASRPEPQPLTYRGVRSLKHRHDKSYTDGLRKSSSLHDLASPTSDPPVGTGPQFNEARSRSQSRDSLPGSDASDQWVSSQSYSGLRGLSKSCSDLTDVGSNQPKTFFEFLINEPPPKPMSKNSRYMRLAGIPQNRPIEDYEPVQSSAGRMRPRHKSGPTTDLEHLEANHVADKAKFWEAKSSNTVDFPVSSATDQSDVGLVRNSYSLGSINKSSHSGTRLRVTKSNSAITNGVSSVESDRGDKYLAGRVTAGNQSASNNALKSTSHTKVTNSPRFASNISKVSNTGRASRPSVTTGQSPNRSTNTPPVPPVRSSSQKYSTAIASKTSIPPPPTRTRSRLTRNTALSQDQPHSESAQQGEPRAGGTSSQVRGLLRGASLSNSHTVETGLRSHSPTSSLLLNGFTKNETDEHKMAKSDFNTPLVNEDIHPNDPVVSVHQDLDYIKKGWLVKQGESDKEWNKFWFVLSGSSLKYYDNMEAEKSGHERGTIDLAACYDISEVTIARKYAFKLRTSKGDHILSALTFGIRKNWMQAISQCLQKTGASSSPQESTSQPTRRANDRYHTHSGTFITRAASREPLDVPKDHSTKSDVDSSQTTECSFIPSRRTELPSSEPPKYSVHQAGSSDMTLSSPGGSTETVRTRSRRRTTENITRLPEASCLSPTKSNRPSCTWPYEIQENNNLEKTGSNQSLRSSQDSESKHDLTQYLDDSDKSLKLTKQEEEELDNVQKNIRHIHRRSLTESVQIHKLKHLDKFESGTAFTGSQLDRQSSTEHLNRSRSRDRIHSSSNQGSRESSASRASPGRSHDADKVAGSGHQAPSAKIKNKTKVRSSRTKSPPPETMDDDEDYLDTFVRTNLEQSLTDEASGSDNVIEKKWKHVENTPERPPLPSNDSVGDVLVDLWEAEAKSLRNQLIRTQSQLNEVQKQNTELLIKLRRSHIEQADCASDLEQYQSRFMPPVEDYHYLEQTSELCNSRLTEAKNDAERNVKQLQDMEAKLKESEELIQSQEQEIHDLQAKLKVTMSELNKLEATLTESADELHSEQSSSQKIIEELEARIEELEKELETKDHLLHSQGSELQQHKKTIQSLEDKLAEKDERIHLLEEKLHHLESEIQEKVSLAEDLTQENDLLRKQLRDQDESYQKSLADSTNKMKTMEEEFYNAKQQMQMRLEQMQQHLEQITKQSNMADSLNANMADILKEKDETIAQLEEKLIEMESRIGEISEELHVEVEENGKLQARLDQSEKEKDHLQKQNAEMQSELTEVEEEYNKLVNEMRDLNKRLSEHDTERELLTQDLKRVEAQVKQLREENDELRRQTGSAIPEDYHHLKTRCDELCSDLDKANNEIFMMSDRLDNVEREKESLQRINNEALNELEQLRTLYEVAVRDLNESQNKTSDFEEQIRNMNRQHHSDLQAKEQDIHDLQFQLNQYKAEHEQVKKKLSNLESVKAELTQQLDVQQKKFQTEMEAKYNELSASQKLLDEVQEKLKQTEGSVAKESQFLAQLSRSEVLQRSEHGQSKSGSESSYYSDIPTSYDELKTVYKKLASEHWEQKRQLSEMERQQEEADSANLSLKQHVKNLESGYQSQVDELSAKVRDLTTQLSNMERRKKRLERRTHSQEILGEVDQESQTDFEHSELVQEHMHKIQKELETSDTKVNQLLDRLMQQRDSEVELELLRQQLVSLQAECSRQKKALASEQHDSIDSSVLDQYEELQLRANLAMDALDECSSKLSIALSSPDDGQCRVIIESVIEKLREARALLPQRDKMDDVALSDDIKLRLFSERLALEAVILGEMSYLVHTERNQGDQVLRDMHLAKIKIEEITSALQKQYCIEGSIEKSGAESLSACASLLARKLRIQTQLLLKMDDLKSLSSSNVDVFVSDNKRLEHVAHTALSQSSLSLCTETPLVPILNACYSVASVQSDLALLLSKLREHTENQDGCDIGQKYLLDLCQELAVRNVNLQQMLAPVIEENVREVTRVLLECDRYGTDQSVPSLELFSEELRHITKQYLSVTEQPISSTSDRLYSEAFSKHLNQTVDEHIHKLLQDIESTCKNISIQEAGRNRTELEECRTQCLLKLGYLLSQMSFVQALATYFISFQITHSQTTSSPSSGANETANMSSSLSSSSSSSASSSIPALTSSTSSQSKSDIATLLARAAASRNDLASFLLSNTARGELANLKSTCSDQIVSLASQLLNLDLKLMDCQSRAVDYPAVIEREAVTQAQLSYIIQYMKLRHKAEIEVLRKEMENKESATQETDKYSEEIEELSLQLDCAHKQRVQVEEIAADLESELQRKENNFRQEVQALKDGYEIRIRSLQADLDVAKNDLEKIQQERELESHQYEESIHASIIEYERKIEKIVSEKEKELSECSKRIEELEEQLTAMKANYEKLRNMTSEDDLLARSLSTTSDQLEFSKEQIEEVDALRQQLEEEKKRHIAELERLQPVLDGDSTAAAQAILTTKIQQLEERLHNMQHDYEQELSVQKAAHQRELARSKEDMMQLLAMAEAKSMHIDEEVIRKRYMKEIDKIRVLYDRSFAAMEKSHQKVIMQMRKAHKRELDSLRQEKDQVLAEETKATQAALDAMRKAHEKELQKERNKFLDVIAKTYSQADVESLQKQHEADLDLIQAELKELSEQYSFRCLEKISLEQKLWAQSNTVQKCRKHIQELMASREEVIARNRHEIEKIKRQVLNPNKSSSASPADGQDWQMLLKTKDAEIHQLQDEIKMLKDQLQRITEELEENMEKFHELNSIHDVSEQQHQRELTDLHQQVQEQATANSSSDDSLSLDSPQDEEPNEDGFLASTPCRSTSTASEKNDFKLSEVKATETNTGNVMEHKNVKKSFWRQRQPQRARSTPGLSEVSVTLQKQMSADSLAGLQHKKVLQTSTSVEEKL